MIHIKTENIKKGMEIKNYKELCNILNIKVKAGNSKKAQLKDLERYCKYHKEGNRFIIDSVYRKIKTKQDKRKDNEGGNNLGKFKLYNEFNVKLNHYFDKGVYIIKKCNNVYIGSTNRNFRERFLEHYHNSQNLMNHTQYLLLNGGNFEILEIMNNSTEKDIRLQEQYYIDCYLKDKDFVVVNKAKEIGYKNKIKYKTINIPKENYEKAIKLLEENNLIGGILNSGNM